MGSRIMTLQWHLGANYYAKDGSGNTSKQYQNQRSVNRENIGRREESNRREYERFPSPFKTRLT